MINYIGGYGTPYGYAGIWEDTQTWVLENLPAWATGVRAIDVPEGEAGVLAMQELMPTLQGEEKVLLSPRAQMALWTMLAEAADSIDRQLVATADIGGRTGEGIRTFLEAQKGEIASQAMQLARLNDSALAMGVEPAYLADWFPEEASRMQVQAAPAVATSPVIWTVVIAIVIASAVMATAITVGIIWSKSLDVRLQESEVASLPDAESRLAYYERKMAYKYAPGSKGGIPWGWVAFAAVIGVGGILAISWVEGSLGRWTKKLTGGSSILRPYGT